MDINVVAVVVAAIVGFGIGWAWYSEFLFGKPWRREMNIPDGGVSMEGMGKSMTLGFIATLVMAYVLENMIIATAASTVSAALVLGVWLWAGFVATIMLGGVLWEKKSWKLYGINAAHYFVVILVMAAILTLWA
ncbi:MAG TPA: DUF1761 domain-containing protein [Candidatus Paceibacterota bacterium]|jgi:hypothetical protein